MKNVKLKFEDCEWASNPIFEKLLPSEIQLIEENKVCNIYKKSQAIFHEGNPPLGLYCVHEGNVKVFKTGVDGREQIVRMAKKGDIIGYRALIGKEIYTATASAIVDSKICFIEKQVFFDIINSNQEMLWAMMRLLAHELHAAEDFLADMAQKTVRERLAEVLILLKNKYGCQEVDDETLNVILSRDELASIVGTATETLIRHLSDFKDEGVIQVKGRKIKIVDSEKLIGIANISL